MPRYLTLLLLCLSVSGCNPGYYLRATWEQTNILLAREDIPDALEGEELTEEQKEKLQLVLDVQRWVQTKGFYQSDSYTSYADIGRDKLVFVLTAAPKTSLKPKTWWFPVVGTIPYKGFFDEQDAKDAAAELEAEGYDVHVRESVAYSTLGWFDDPVLNTMLKLSKVALANTIIHETFHQTVWIEDEVEFNESLANVVGTIGAKLYFEEMGQEEELVKARKDLLQITKISNFLEELETELKKVYSNYPEEEALLKRETAFQRTLEKWALPPETLGGKVNNALVIGKITYYRKVGQLMQAFHSCDHSLECLLGKSRKIKNAPWANFP